MVEVGIPVYRAKATLPNTLDSLVAQTYKEFVVTLSIDGDNEDYDDIIKNYRERGLEIKAGANVGVGKDYTLYALADGVVEFDSKSATKKVSVKEVK